MGRSCERAASELRRPAKFNFDARETFAYTLRPIPAILTHPYPMKTQLPLALALLLGMAWQGNADAENPARVFPPRLLPIADADPAVREEQEVLVPTALTAVRNGGVVEVGQDNETLKTIKLMVGSKMLVGMSTELYVYPEGGARPAQPQRMGLSGPPSKSSKSKSLLHPRPDGFLQPGKPYVIEQEVVIFETDIPAQHMWNPHGERYKVLWRATLRQTVK